MTTELPPFAPYHVRLCGHTDLGVVQARWRGCLLEIEGGTTYGPSALFRVDKVATKASEPKPAPAPPAMGPVLRRWARVNEESWLLADNSQSTMRYDGMGVVAIVNDAGWFISSTAGSDPQPPRASGHHRGLAGREFARDWWLEHGAVHAPGADFSLHDTCAVSALDVGGKVVLLDGSAKTAVAGTAREGRVLFDDGTWMTADALSDAIDRIVCLSGDDDIPF